MRNHTTTVQQCEAFHFTLTFVGSLLADGEEDLLGRLLRRLGWAETNGAL